MRIYTLCITLALIAATSIYAGKNCTDKGCGGQMAKGPQAECATKACTVDEECPAPQKCEAPPEGRKMGRRERPQGPPPIEKRVERLTKRLELTDAQQESVKALLTAEREKIEELRKARTKPREMFKEIRQIHEDTYTSIKALLSPDQQSKYEKMHARQRNRMKERRENRRENRRERGAPEDGPAAPTK